MPTLVHDGKVIIELTLIMDTSTRPSREIPLMPSDPYARSQVRLWLKRVDDYTVTAARSPRRWRSASYFMRQSPDGCDAYVARTLDPVKLERLQKIMRYRARGTRCNGCGAPLRHLRRRHG